MESDTKHEKTDRLRNRRHSVSVNPNITPGWQNNKFVMLLN